MKNFRYSLQKKGLKLVCPSCGKNKRFVPYMDNSTGQILHSTVGKCDRESKCGYHLTPGDYFKSNGAMPAGKWTAPKPEPPKPMGLLPIDLVNQSKSLESNFAAFLGTLFPDGAVVQDVCNKYNIGATKQREVIFWQVDELEQVRSGKIMQYSPETGKRSKMQSTDWIHSRMIKSKQLDKDFNLIQCFYGQHLLKNNPAGTVAVVESEKTAIIASGLIPNLVWIAAGSLQGLNIDKCKCLTGRNVILYPDLSEKKANRLTAFEIWSAKAIEIMRAYKCKVIVSDLLEQKADEADRQNGLDVADYLIRELKAPLIGFPLLYNPKPTPIERKAPPIGPPSVGTPPKEKTKNINDADDSDELTQRLSLSDVAMQVIGERNHLSRQALIDRMAQMYSIDSSRAETGLKSLIDSKLIEPTRPLHIGTFMLVGSTPF